MACRVVVNNLKFGLVNGIISFYDREKIVVNIGRILEYLYS